MLHLMRQALADTAAAGQDDRPSAGGDVDMVDQGAAAPDPQVPTGVSLSKAQNARTCARAAVRGATTTGARRAMPRRARGSRPGSGITYGSARA